ncbi:hypothetical protein DL98DRAFT_442386, partial [Cadophora sp. DSE1049]
LKSGDLSIKTLNRNDTKALKQFANNWINWIRRGISIQLAIYEILAYGIRTSLILCTIRLRLCEHLINQIEVVNCFLFKSKKK